MSILATKDTHVVIQGGLAGVNAARRMAEFCYMNKQRSEEHTSELQSH